LSEKKNILRFWRDTEIFNIPTVPKRENKTKLKVTTYQHGSLLPWQKGHKNSLISTENEVWTHAVFLGVTESRRWAQVVLQATCPEQKLDGHDLEQLGGNGWLAAFIVNSGGHMVSDSYIPASFALGVQRLRVGETLDNLDKDIRKQIEKFRERCPETQVYAKNGEESEALAAANSEHEQRIQPRSVSIGWAELDIELHHALDMLGTAAPNLSFSVVIKSTLRRKNKNDTVSKAGTDIDFLNSFYLNDLDCLIEELDNGNFLNRTLEQYLDPPSQIGTRRDILRDPRAMADCIAPLNLTLGRWPASSKHHLMLAQQAAVGSIMSQLHDEAGGLVAVNGPPGTGKTTLLCDIVADVLVQRALKLAKLEAPKEAFGNKTTVGGRNVYPLKPEIVVGTGIVVTSNNNTAVENITRELPALAKIAKEEHESAAYFNEVAAQVFAAAGIKAPAWGLVAAALGNSDNRRQFANAFFCEKNEKPFVPGQPCDIKTLLEASPDDANEQWKEAKRSFLDLFKQVDATRSTFDGIRKALAKIASLHLQKTEIHQQIENKEAELLAVPSKWAVRIQKVEIMLKNSQTELEEAAKSEKAAELAAQIYNGELQGAQIRLAPRFLDRLLKALGIITRKMREYDNAMLDLQEQLNETNKIHLMEFKKLQNCKQAIRQYEKELAELKISQHRESANLKEQLELLKHQLKQVQQRCKQCKDKVHEWKKQTGSTVPDEAFFKLKEEDRHLASIWVNPNFDRLRAQLFLSALRLHETTLLACKGKAIANLRAVKDMLNRNTPEPISKDQRGLLWDMLFFTVPVVSSTLASFDRLFAGLGSESLGWLLIDEAGQATPQSVVGALWRSKRAVVIGDPLQIEPVMTVPSAIVGELSSWYRLDALWSPCTQSAQTLADRTMTLGAWIGDPGTPETSVWTGLPLRAHRRCTDPMFTVANAIAYKGQMVQANKNPSMIDCCLSESAWFNVQGISCEDQVVHEEIDLLATLLCQLRDNWPTRSNGELANLFVISPFRKVAEKCKSAFDQAGVRSTEWPISSGTVHRFQGKEADIVLIVLGSAPGKAGSGSRNWASSKPNLLNVALTRAKLRVYMIGNIADWESYPGYDVLAKEFRKNNQVIEENKTFFA
jgi:hypothetical protein